MDTRAHVDPLGLIDLRVTSSGLRDGYIAHLCEANKRPVGCVHCGSVAIAGHGTREQVYPDTPIQGKPACLILNRRRYKCADCGKTFFEPVADLDPKRLATSRLVEFVQSKALTRTFTEISKDVGIDEKTVQRIVLDYIPTIEALAGPKMEPEILGIDEVKILGRYCCVLTNIGERRFFDIFPGREKKIIKDYFDASGFDPKKVKVFVTDLWNNYLDIARTFFPHAITVTDKFHVVRAANVSIEDVRLHVRRTSLAGQANTRDRIALKDQRYLLTTHGFRLKDKQRESLETLLAKYPLLRPAYETKERFYRIWEAPTRKEAEELYDAWRDSIPDEVRRFFGKTVDPIENNRREVFNVFDFPTSNAFTEGFNRVIKDMNRVGRGYSQEILRARLLYTNIEKGTERVTIRSRRKNDGSLEFVGYGRTTDTGPEFFQEEREMWVGIDLPTLIGNLETYGDLPSDP